MADSPSETLSTVSGSVVSGSVVSRRTMLASLAGLALAGPLAGARAAMAPSRVLPKMVVYKDPNCGCCKQWVAHAQKAGFTVEAHDTSDMDTVKASMGVPTALASCHTAKVGTYVIEGHVPADLIIKLLDEKSTTRGLAVPGMPAGSPGMEMGNRKDAFDVVAFEKDGRTRVYARR